MNMFNIQISKIVWNKGCIQLYSLYQCCEQHSVVLVFLLVLPYNFLFFLLLVVLCWVFMSKYSVGLLLCWVLKSQCCVVLCCVVQNLCCRNTDYNIDFFELHINTIFLLSIPNIVQSHLCAHIDQPASQHPASSNPTQAPDVTNSNPVLQKHSVVLVFLLVLPYNFIFFLLLVVLCWVFMSLYSVGLLLCWAIESLSSVGLLVCWVLESSCSVALLFCWVLGSQCCVVLCCVVQNLCCRNTG